MSRELSPTVVKALRTIVAKGWSRSIEHSSLALRELSVRHFIAEAGDRSGVMHVQATPAGLRKLAEFDVSNVETASQEFHVENSQ